MASTQNETSESLSTKDFLEMYNRWLIELDAVEKTITSKANEIQLLQTNLSEEAESLKVINNTLLPVQVEQNSLEDYVNSLCKLQEDLEKEIISISETELPPEENEPAEYEESPFTIEATDMELKNITETVKNTVNKINSELNWFEKTLSPMTKFRIIMDRYTDALQLLEKSTADIHEKLNGLNTTNLQQYINADGFP